MIDTKDRSNPLAMSSTKAIAHLKASGNWPRPVNLLNPDADYYVLAAFWGRWGALTSYLSNQPAMAQQMA